jgi:hypothetical protein
MPFKTIVVGRSGESLSGRLLDKSFTIQSSFGVPLTIKTDRIHWIHFRNPPFFDTDEIWALPDDRVRGAIQGKAISFKPDGGAKVTIAFSTINTIVLNQVRVP